MKVIHLCLFLLTIYINLETEAKLKKAPGKACRSLKWSKVLRANNNSTRKCTIKRPKVIKKPAANVNTTIPKKPYIIKEKENTTTILIKQGFDASIVPTDLENFNHFLVSDYHINYKTDAERKFLTVESTKHSNVFIAEYKDRPVVVKEFISSGIHSAYEVGMIMSYVSDTVSSAGCHGFVRVQSRIGMIQDFDPEAQTLQDLLIESNVTDSQLTEIVIQVTTAMLNMHKKFVLHNDYHSSNILVSLKAGQPKVTVIDLENASFRTGTYYEGISKKIYPFLAPELDEQNVLTTPYSDVWSLGEMLRQINRRLKKRVLDRIVVLCMKMNPKKRPSVRFVHMMISTFLQNLRLENTTLTVIKRERNVTLDLEDMDFMTKSIPLVTETKPISTKTDRHMWVARTETTQAFLGYLYGRAVVVKVNKKTDFMYTQTEALVNQYMNDTGVVPSFYGFYPTGELITSLGIVNEFFGSGVVLEELVEDMAQQSLPFQLSVMIEICKIVQTFHNRSLLINNIGVDNFLVHAEPDRAVLKIIGLDSVSGLNGLSDPIILEELKHFPNTAPEVSLHLQTSIESDIYSVGSSLMKLNLHDGLKLQVATLFDKCLLQGITNCPNITHVLNVLSDIAKPVDIQS